MVMIIEIVLTIIAWRKGWKWWALVPLGLAVSIAFSVGFVIGLLGGSAGPVMPFFMLLDIGCLLALIILIVLPPEREKKAVSEASSMPVCRADEVRY
jgi:zinc transporter ZupT